MGPRSTCSRPTPSSSVGPTAREPSPSMPTSSMTDDVPHVGRGWRYHDGGSRDDRGCKRLVDFRGGDRGWRNLHPDGRGGEHDSNGQWRTYDHCRLDRAEHDRRHDYKHGGTHAAASERWATDRGWRCGGRNRLCSFRSGKSPHSRMARRVSRSAATTAPSAPPSARPRSTIP